MEKGKVPNRKTQSIIFAVLSGLVVVGFLAFALQNQKTQITSPTLEGLVGYWSMDSNDIYNSTIYDGSGYENHGTIVGATVTDGKIKQALRFDGLNDYMEVPHSDSLNITDGITLEAWVKKEDQPLPVTNNLVLHFDATTIEGLDSGSNVEQWNDISGNDYHVFAVHETERPVYMANVLNGKPVVRFDRSNDERLQATSSDIANFNDQSFVVFVVFRSTQSGVRGRPVDQRGTGVYGTQTGWQLCTETDNTWGNSSVDDGDGSHIYGVGSPVVFPNDGEGHIVSLEWDNLTGTGIIRNNGSNESPNYNSQTNSNLIGADLSNTRFFTVGGASDVTTQSFTGDLAEIIIYERALSTEERQEVEQYLGEKWLDWEATSTTTIINKGQDAYSLEVSNDGSMLQGYVNDTALATSLTKSSDWNHVALTYDNSNIRLYVNGSLATSTSLSGDIATNTTDLIIGQDFAGKIDEVRIYDRALSTSEVSQNYRATGRLILDPNDPLMGTAVMTGKLIGLALHLDVSTITGLNDDDPVEQWSDLSNTHYHAFQADSDKRPIYKTSILDGKPVIRFSPGHSLTTSEVLVNTGSLSIFAVSRGNHTGEDIGVILNQGNIGGDGEISGNGGNEPEPDCTDWWSGQSQPYEISNVQDLQCMSDDLTADYILVNNIDVSATRNWNWNATTSEYEGFKPIGTGDGVDRFTGTFDGQDYTIDGLFIDRSVGWVGLFGSIINAEISNVKLINVDISGGGTEWWTEGTGALIGTDWGSSEINNCETSGSVTVSTDSGGGLAGIVRDSYSSIENCESKVDITGEDNIGGLVGYLFSKQIISNSSASGNVSGNSGVGGLVGRNRRENEIYNSYASGNVEGTSRVGGLVGFYDGSATIIVSKSYAAGSVSGTSNIGGLVGEDGSGGSTTTDSFWDTEISGQAISAAGTGKTTAEMKNINTFTSTSTVGLDEPWDIAQVENWDGETWFIDDGNDYPRLGWEMFVGGDGSEENPYQIHNCFALQAMANNLSAYYVLINDIDCSDTVNWNNGAGFLPIGKYGESFEGGIFDGQGHIISNLYINTTRGDVGLFGRIDGSDTEIKNVGLVDAYVYTTGSQVGALVGSVFGGKVINSYSTGYVRGFGNGVAGLVGYPRFDTVLIENSYSTANVSASGVGGGLVGRVVDEATIRNSYATGNIERWTGSDSRFGAFAGEIHRGATIENSYATGNVFWQSAPHPTDKGFVGEDDEGGPFVYSNNFFDSEASNQSTALGATPKTTTEMQDILTFTSTSTVGLDNSWDFDETWGIHPQTNNGYPYLQIYPLNFKYQYKGTDIEALVRVRQTMRGVLAAAEDFKINSFISNKSEGKLYIDGSLAASTTYSTVPASAKAPIDIGNLSFDGDIAEILIYKRALSNLERQRVEQYLGEKWLGW